MDYIKLDDLVNQNFEVDIKIYDYYEEDEKIIYEILALKPDIIGISCYLWNYSRSMDLIRKCKLVDNQVITFCGGPEVTDGEKTLKENSALDLVCIGDGEITVKDILHWNLGKKNISDISGVFYRCNENIIGTGAAKVVSDLDEIPTITNNKIVQNSDFILYETSRGCPFGCKYCCWTNKKMRYYSLNRVEKDLKKILNYKNVNQIFLIDSELDIDIERAKKVLNIVIENNTRNVDIQAFFGFHTYDEELVKLIRKANIKIGIGVQSTNENTIKINGREWFKKDEMKETINHLKKYFSEREIELQLIFGLPGDNYESFKESLNWCFETGLRNITANRLYILPGSKLYNEKEQYEIIADDKPFHLVYSTSTYSYQDIIRSEALFIAFSFIRKILSNEDVQCLKSVINIWTLIEILGDYLLKNGLCFSKRQEISNQEVHEKINYQEVIENVILRENPSIDKKVYEFLIYKYNVYSSYKYFVDIYYKVLNEKVNNGNRLKIHKYFIVKSVDIDATKNQHEIFLLNYKTMAIRRIFINKKYLKSINRLLLMINGEMTYDELRERITKDFEEREMLLRFLQVMKESNLLTYV